MKDSILNYVNSFGNFFHTVGVIMVFIILAIIFTWLSYWQQGVLLSLVFTLIFDLFFGIGRNSPFDVSKETVAAENQQNN